MKTIEELTGYDKAAIIYAILGDSVVSSKFPVERGEFKVVRFKLAVVRDKSKGTRPEILGSRC